VSRLRLAGYGVAAALAVVAYLHGLSGEHIPKNGDEYPYTHITRLTAASGHLLPLCSDLPGMRNTKPPLLFWQGIASTGGGRWWTRWNLRWPSVAYTLLTAGLVFLLGRRLGDDSETGLLAALSFLEALAGAGLFPVERVKDVRPYKAAKLMYNAAISPLAAAAGVDNGELLTDRLAKRLFFALLRENHSILRHARVPLARIGPFHPDTVSRILRTPGLASLMAVFFRPSLRGTYCSMSPDIATGRTEIDAYNGHLIRLAGQFPCPLNRAAFALIERMVRERLSPARERLRQMAETLPTGTRS
jgi:hypothetical protein